jgi:hypothetical protein
MRFVWENANNTFSLKKLYPKSKQRNETTNNFLLLLQKTFQKKFYLTMVLSFLAIAVKIVEEFDKLSTKT